MRTGPIIPWNLPIFGIHNLVKRQGRGDVAELEVEEEVVVEEGEGLTDILR